MLMCTHMKAYLHAYINIFPTCPNFIALTSNRMGEQWHARLFSYQSFHQRCKPTHNQGQALKSNVTIRTETSQQQSKVASQIRALFYILPQQVELFRDCTLRKQPRGNSLCGACTTKDIASKPANTSSTHPGISWLMHESTDCHILHAVGTITSLKHANSLCIMYKVI